MFFKKPHEKLNKKIENLMWTYSNQIQGESFSDVRKKTLNGVVFGAGLYTNGLIFCLSVEHLSGKKSHIKNWENPIKYLKNNINPVEVFDFACCVVIDTLSRYISKNRDSYAAKVGTIDEGILLIPPKVLGTHLGSDRTIRINSLISKFQEIVKIDKDPRDLWIDQDFQFYENILDNFDIRNYYTRYPLDSLFFHKSSLDLRVSIFKNFNQFLE